MDAFKQFVQKGIKSTDRILQEELFFGMTLPKVDLKMIKDTLGNGKPWHSFLKESADKLPFLISVVLSGDHAETEGVSASSVRPMPRNCLLID